MLRIDPQTRQTKGRGMAVLSGRIATSKELGAWNRQEAIHGSVRHRE
jgi:hypothetical protein